MGARFFPNEMPHFIPEPQEEEEEKAFRDSLPLLLHLPYKSLSQKLTQTAIHIKQTVVKETWLKKGKRVGDYSLYTGALGTAFLLFKAYLVTKDRHDLDVCSEIIKACDHASNASGRVTFICGEAGAYSLGAVVAWNSGNNQLCDYYLTRMNEMKLPSDLPNELLYGRAGFLWACLFLNKNIGEGTISPTKIRGIVDDIIKSGRKLAKRGCPLMFEWHGKKYWGAAHGLAGIMHVLLHTKLEPDEQIDVKGTLRYMIRNRISSGNYPSSDENESDRLVHWCHGAPGVCLTLVQAAKVFGDDEFLEAAIDAAEVVWHRGLLTRVGICHGVSGNTYVFLSLYRLTGKVEYLYKAKAFASFLHERASALISEGVMHGGDSPYSLFEGIGGMALLFLDMSEPSEARFPAYEL